MCLLDRELDRCYPPSNTNQTHRSYTKWVAMVAA